jgi:hypothetical protein
MISIILIFLAGICDAILDVLDFHYETSIFSTWKHQNWINPIISWHNKWKNGDYTQGEKFLGSSTFFVWLTDFWHFCKFLMLIFIMIAIVLYHPLIIWWVDFLILYCVYTVTFQIFFNKIFVKHKNIKILFKHKNK